MHIHRHTGKTKRSIQFQNLQLMHIEFDDATNSHFPSILQDLRHYIPLPVYSSEKQH